MDNRGTKDLRERMEQHQELPPENLWESIESIIYSDDFILSTQKNKKVALVWRRLGAVAAIILLFVIGGYYLLIRDSSQQPLQLVTQRETIINESGKTQIISQNDKQVAYENENNRTQSAVSTVKDQSNLIVQNAQSKYTTQIDLQQTDKPSIKEETTNEIDNIIRDTRDSIREAKNIVNRDSEKQKDRYQNETNYEDNSPVITTRKDKPSSWTTDIYASNISSGTTKKIDGYAELTSEVNSMLEAEPMGNIISENVDLEINSKTKHKQPIKIGVLATYNLNDKWSISSGLIYTLLSSSLQSGSNNNYYTSRQTLQNIGIPLNAKYNVWKNNKCSIYLAAGGTAEKNISGMLNTDYIVNNKTISTRKNKISISQLQWSLNASVGVEYNLFENVGIYAEPGISHYFDNSSKIETIYKERRTIFNLNLGISIHFGR